MTVVEYEVMGITKLAKNILSFLGGLIVATIATISIFGSKIRKALKR